MFHKKELIMVKEFLIDKILTFYIETERLNIRPLSIESLIYYV